MRKTGFWIAIVASMGLVGCASTGGDCRGPSYVVPPPLPPLQVPAGLSAPPDHSRYPADTSLPATAAAPAPGAGREAKPPSGPVAPAISKSPPAPNTAVPPGMSGPPLSSTQSNAQGGATGGATAPASSSPSS